MHVRMRDLRERALAVQRSCGHACGFVVARRFFRVPRGAVWSCVAITLRSLGASMARSASWPSIKLAGLMCNWISMAPSNVAIVIRSRYLAAPKAHRKFWPSPHRPPQRQIGHAGGGSDPPSTKSIILGGGADPPSTKSVMLGGGTAPWLKGGRFRKSVFLGRSSCASRRDCS